jgi:K+-sensing histidine kinase KdpD
MESWAPRHAFLDYVDECIDMAEEMYKKRRKEEHANIKSSAGKVAAILIAFFAIELYMQFVPHASDLQFVDLRLLLIVWSGLIAGKQMGLVSAVCCSVGSIIQCLASGVKWYVIFYHVDNWIPLAVYFIAAILIGTYYEAIQEQNARREDDDHPMDP